MQETKTSTAKMLRFVDSDPKKAQFYNTLRKRVDAYFQDNNLSKKGNFAMFLKSFIFCGGTILFYALIMSGQFSPPMMLLWAICLGAFAAFVGFNVSHDAIHGSYSNNTLLNKIMGHSFSLLGANVDVWRVSHNAAHHTYTNIAGHDEDIEVAPGILRLSEAEKLKGIMRYQHIYAFPLYGLASLSWVLRKDYIKFFKEKIGQIENRKESGWAYFNLFFFKLLYYVLFIVLPLVFLDITVPQFLFGFLMMHLTEGLILGLVFQLAHVVEGTDFPNPNQEGNIEENWAIHQMHTTANFARESAIANYLCGGLNFQIEHHLFPHICHVHYKEISKIVEATAKEFGVPYIENKTFWGALQSHYRCLKKFGKEALEAAQQAAKPQAQPVELS